MANSRLRDLWDLGMLPEISDPKAQRKAAQEAAAKASQQRMVPMRPGGALLGSTLQSWQLSGQAKTREQA